MLTKVKENGTCPQSWPYPTNLHLVWPPAGEALLDSILHPLSGRDTVGHLQVRGDDGDLDDLTTVLDLLVLRLTRLPHKLVETSRLLLLPGI